METEAALERIKAAVGPRGWIADPGEQEPYLVEARRLYRGATTRASATGTRPRTAVPSDARQVPAPPRRRSENGAFIEVSSRLVLADGSPQLLSYLVLGRHVQYRRLICEICSRE